MSDFLLSRLAIVDFESRYIKLCDSGECFPSMTLATGVTWGGKHLESVAFLAAYLLLLAIKVCRLSTTFPLY